MMNDELNSELIQLGIRNYELNNELHELIQLGIMNYEL